MTFLKDNYNSDSVLHSFKETGCWDWRQLLPTFDCSPTLWTFPPLPFNVSLTLPAAIRPLGHCWDNVADLQVSRIPVKTWFAFARMWFIQLSACTFLKLWDTVLDGIPWAVIGKLGYSVLRMSNTCFGVNGLKFLGSDEIELIGLMLSVASTLQNIETH